MLSARSKTNLTFQWNKVLQHCIINALHFPAWNSLASTFGTSFACFSFSEVNVAMKLTSVRHPSLSWICFSFYFIFRDPQLPFKSPAFQCVCFKYCDCSASLAYSLFVWFALRNWGNLVHDKDGVCHASVLCSCAGSIESSLLIQSSPSFFVAFTAAEETHLWSLPALQPPPASRCGNVGPTTSCGTCRTRPKGKPLSSALGTAQFLTVFLVLYRRLLIRNLHEVHWRRC